MPNKTIKMTVKRMEGCTDLRASEYINNYASKKIAL